MNCIEFVIKGHDNAIRGINKKIFALGIIAGVVLYKLKKQGDKIADLENEVYYRASNREEGSDI